MTTENITLTNLHAADGMWLTNGKTFGRDILLGINDSHSNWREITEEEKEELEREMQADMHQSEENFSEIE